ncbi:HAD-IIA family hydrolase [Virgibacillus dakarensis]|uniref:Acid sugar phosphatase n=1 Tax=Lentibacillus populi TaxID=1827502 RepID=A0A9W5U140_9BACI|nr:HAD-IIA family hydrolase [Lentibacillus populi]MBT2215563.1 HAD-IIA family hydrolase [Virgibacillus dakarensis]MTW86001.1 HAD-IIA family hydrolase [Virgibacillus dakarensis]GGB56583.1 acid sugar phosphatase [Lentibacillus populi]
MAKGFIFDLDGTVYLDNKLIAGAAETISHLRDRGDKVVFLTNKSIETIQNYVEKLNRLGINTDYHEVINSNYLVARYLKSRLKQNEKVMVIGEQPLFDELNDLDIAITENSKEASYVVLGWDRQFTYEKLNNAFQAWRNGARVIATNPDRTCPVEGGQVPDCGAMIGAMEGATGEKVEIIVGKPSRHAAHFIVSEILQLPPENCFIVGDRLETDIKMGLDYGLQGVLVLTGITNRDMVEDSRVKPSVILDSIREVVNL